MYKITKHINAMILYCLITNGNYHIQPFGADPSVPKLPKIKFNAIYCYFIYNIL